MSSDWLLQIDSLQSGYGDGTVIQSASLELAPGERLGLLGRNGAGKTTLLKTLMGLVPTRSGQVRFKGRTLARLKPFEIARLGIAYVPQGRELFADFSVAQNLKMGAFSAEGNIEPAFDSFPWLADRRDEAAGRLSGGQQQQLAIARAIVSRPKLMLLDEPLEGISPNVVADIADAIERLCEKSELAIVLVEQNVEIVLALCNRIAFIESGQICEIHDSAVVSQRPDLIEKYLGV